MEKCTTNIKDNRFYPGSYFDLLERYNELESQRKDLHGLYVKQLIATATLQEENRRLENLCQFYKQSHKRYLVN